MKSVTILLTDPDAANYPFLYKIEADLGMGMKLCVSKELVLKKAAKLLKYAVERGVSKGIRSRDNEKKSGICLFIYCGKPEGCQIEQSEICSASRIR